MTGTPDAGTERTVWFRVLADYKRGWVNTAYVTDAMEQIVAARVRAAQAQAWDEGKQSDHTIQCRIGDGSDECICENPYRLDAADEFQNSED